MAAQRVDGRVGKPCARASSPAQIAQRRQARVTVKYDRHELQRRLDTEQWLEHSLHELYRGQEQLMPDEVNIDELLDLKTDEEKRTRLKEILQSSNNNTETFIGELLLKLQGLQTQEDLHNNGIKHTHSHICSTRASSTDRDVQV
ncbi:protein phosphatase 1, regulatory (inhibitor) subunit 14Ab [Periophthalmus magnuspinnatus]|uniref:protein phosphatase 1, regulatory (inhibitor) subunit 14Ab n=1 Tax=Periophthalmus magnuspinnatus TaxID=409849 RepID=UPI00145BB3A9|nr:protein phosphatase 1, regulatory (inhibitor) subunit 14Ab [Periophthalmus magnuspinnatus]